jgi:tetratricopeptide (TPR) repeat protein
MSSAQAFENPENLTPLRAFLSSKKMMIVLDNAESILDPQGTDAQEIYAVVEELTQFSNTCVCITTRISTIPPDCKRLDVPTLSMDAALNTFYRIYDSDDRSDLVNGILEQLDFHPLSVTLLATVAHQNKWDTNRLTREWERRRTSVLQMKHNRGLAATIELSLASPTFQELGPDARALLEVVAFFPQGVNENNLDWLLPTVSNGTDIFDGFCILSLTHRSNGFMTMLAPLRDYLRPKDPRSSSLLCTTKECYFTRMSTKISLDNPNFGETRWIISEDVNVEHLLDVFTTIDANSDNIWNACIDFMRHLNLHKRRLIILRPKIEELPDDHRSKPDCLFELSWLFWSVGNLVECKKLLAHSLELWRERGSDRNVARMLRDLSEANQIMGLHEEGIQQAKEASEIYERLGDTAEQARCLVKLALLFQSDKQFNAAEEAASRGIDLLPEKGDQTLVYDFHRALGMIYRSKGEAVKALHHFELALGIASSFNWHDALFWAHCVMAELFRKEGRLDDAQTHVEQAKPHSANSAYNPGHVMRLQARIWYDQHRFEEARSEAQGAAQVYERLGAAEDVERCRRLLQNIEMELNSPTIPGQSDLDREFL